MACIMCEHCQTPLYTNERVAQLEGHSFHEKCRKCYVCSETNLHDAEVFKGVIFCSSCSQRIFQGCSTARKTKDTVKRSRDRSHKRRSHRTRERQFRPQNGILAMTGLAVSSDTSKSCCDDASIGSKNSKSLAISTELALTVGKPIYNEAKDFKKSSAEMGMTTDVTQQLLKQLDCPVVQDGRNIKSLTRPAITLSPFKKKALCSDLRIAELGTSREIANMTLRRKSEMPVIVAAESPMKDTSQSESQNVESDDHRTEWNDSSYSTSKNSAKSCWMDRRLGSILKLPYYSFKRNILNKSSEISVLMSSQNKTPLKERLKRMLREDIADHQKRGVKRLYSTINRRQAPRRLGWVHLVSNANENCLHTSAASSQSSSVTPPSAILSLNIRCKHLLTSHSYRCMRSQAMRLAGPTKDELAEFRSKVKQLILTPGFIRTLSINYRKYPALTISHGCGSSNTEPSIVH